MFIRRPIALLVVGRHSHIVLQRYHPVFLSASQKIDGKTVLGPDDGPDLIAADGNLFAGSLKTMSEPLAAAAGFIAVRNLDVEDDVIDHQKTVVVQHVAIVLRRYAAVGKLTLKPNFRFGLNMFLFVAGVFAGLGPQDYG